MNYTNFPTSSFIPHPSSFIAIPALFGLAAAAAKIFWLIVFGVNEEEFRAVELRKH